VGFLLSSREWWPRLPGQVLQKIEKLSGREKQAPLVTLDNNTSRGRRAYDACPGTSSQQDPMT